MRWAMWTKQGWTKADDVSPRMIAWSLATGRKVANWMR